MKLGKKKELARRTLKVGKDRIVFADSRLDEIQESITKQDIRERYESGAIMIKGIKGRRKITKKKRKRSVGNIRQKVNSRKRDYITITRKLRRYVSDLKGRGVLSRDDFNNIRKKIKNRQFKNKSQLKAYINDLK